MIKQKHKILLGCLLLSTNAQADLDMSNRVHVINTVTQANTNQYLASSSSDTAIYSQQQYGMRLMLEQRISEHHEWDMHYQLRTTTSTIPGSDAKSQTGFRVTGTSQRVYQNEGSYFIANQEIDQLRYKINLGSSAVMFGRSPISFGFSHIFQPLDIFNAFASLELDREYKRGIDLLQWSYHLSDFSAVTYSDILTRNDLDETVHHYNLRGQHLFSDTIDFRWMLQYQEDLLVLGWGIQDNIVRGTFYFDNLSVKMEQSWQQQAALGVNFQATDTLHFISEFFYNSTGAINADSMSTVTISPYLKHFNSRYLFAMNLAWQAHPLLSTHIGVLASYLGKGERQGYSTLPQLALRYSLSGEADLLLVMMFPSGNKLVNGDISSEFGHVPASALGELIFYF